MTNNTTNLTNEETNDYENTKKLEKDDYIQDNKLRKKEIFKKFEKVVTNYINSVHEKDEFLYNLNDIKKTFEDDPILKNISTATFYRYIEKMNIAKLQHPFNGKMHYDFKKYESDDEDIYLDFKLSFQKYNHTLYATVDPCLGEYLSAILNERFERSLFFSTCTQGLLSCYYYYKKNLDESELGKTYLTSAYLKKEIKKIIY